MLNIVNMRRGGEEYTLVIRSRFDLLLPPEPLNLDRLSTIASTLISVRVDIPNQNTSVLFRQRMENEMAPQAPVVRRSSFFSRDSASVFEFETKRSLSSNRAGTVVERSPSRHQKQVGQRHQSAKSMPVVIRSSYIDTFDASNGINKCMFLWNETARRNTYEFYLISRLKFNKTHPFFLGLKRHNVSNQNSSITGQQSYVNSSRDQKRGNSNTDSKRKVG